MTRIRTILCPVDFFPSSLRAFGYAVNLASACGAKLLALHVVPRIVPGGAALPAKLSQAEQKRSRQELEKLKAAARKAGVTVETALTSGDVDLQILASARDSRADVMIMGTHGRRPFERWVMGSVVERMMRYSPIPVIAVSSGRKRTLSPAPIRRILVTSDFSKGTADAVDFASNLAALHDAEVLLLHVARDLSAAEGWKEIEPQVEHLRGELEALVPAAARRSGRVTVRVETGEPYGVILKAARDWKAGLIVMNTHGKGFVERVLLGSTAERVFRGAGEICPVLLIPPRPPRRR